MKYLALLWEAVGKKLILLPTAAGTLLGLFGLPKAIQWENPLFWYVSLTPLILWVIFGLLIQAVKYERLANLSPKPNETIRFAFHHLMVDSKWGLGKRPPTEKYPDDPDNFYPELESALRDAARNEDIDVWAREEPYVPGKGGVKNTLEKVPPEEWKHRRFDLPTCMDVTAPTPKLGKYGGKFLEDVQVNKDQVIKTWPKATLFEKLKDPTFKERLSFYKKESHSED